MQLTTTEELVSAQHTLQSYERGYSHRLTEVEGGCGQLSAGGAQPAIRWQGPENPEVIKGWGSA